MKIGIFGGSFNPPHKIHQKIATYLIDNNYLDKVNSKRISNNIFIFSSQTSSRETVIQCSLSYDMLEKSHPHFLMNL